MGESKNEIPGMNMPYFFFKIYFKVGKRWKNLYLAACGSLPARQPQLPKGFGRVGRCPWKRGGSFPVDFQTEGRFGWEMRSQGVRRGRGQPCSASPPPQLRDALDKDLPKLG